MYLITNITRLTVCLELLIVWAKLPTLSTPYYIYNILRSAKFASLSAMVRQFSNAPFVFCLSTALSTAGALFKQCMCTAYLIQTLIDDTIDTAKWSDLEKCVSITHLMQT